MRKSGAYQYGMPAHKLFTTMVGLPQVVFATTSLGTKRPFVRSLFPGHAQLCTQQNYAFNSLAIRLINAFHRPNNSSNEGE